MHDEQPVQVGLVRVTIADLHGRHAFLMLGRQNDRSIAELLIAMREAVQASKVAGTTIRLNVVKSQDRRFMRWSKRSTYQTWEAIQLELADLPAPVRRHYEQLQRRVMELNALSSLLTDVRHHIVKLADQAGWRRRTKDDFLDK